MAMFSNTPDLNVFIKLRLLLLGEYNGPLTSRDEYGQHIQSAEAKNMEKAAAMLPAYFAAMYAKDEQERAEQEFLFTEGYMRPLGYDLYRYLPDLELPELAKDMKAAGYTQKEISDFATRYIREMMSYEKVCFSSMRLLLFGEHFSGIAVDIPDTQNFENALAFVPDYIDFPWTVYEQDYLCEGSVNLDGILFEYIQKMRDKQYSEEQQVQFASAWFDSIEAQGKISLSLMRVYLSGKFQYSIRDTVDLPLGKKNFAKALTTIPAYMDYLSTYCDPLWDDGVRLSPIRTLENHILPEMQTYGYSDDEIETFRTKWLDYIALCQEKLNAECAKFAPFL